MKLLPSALLTLTTLGMACADFDPPPSVELRNVDNGVMQVSRDEPLVLRVSEGFKTDSLRFKILPVITDADENLLDEQDPPKLQEFKESIEVAWDGAQPDNDEVSYGADVQIDGTDVRVQTKDPLGFATPYYALIEPGLQDFEGNKTLPRLRLPFAYAISGGGPTRLPTGYYYFILNVEFLSVQIRLFTYLDVNPKTGVWRGSYTNGLRLEALNNRPGCPKCSSDAPICALLPSPQCVKPSHKQVKLEEFTDFMPEVDPPDGFAFIADGFVRDESDGTISYGTAPFLIDITIGIGQLNIRAEQTTLTGKFVETKDGRFVASGSAKVERIKLNNAGDSPTKGTWMAMTLTQEEVDKVEALGKKIPTDLKLLP